MATTAEDCPQRSLTQSSASLASGVTRPIAAHHAPCRTATRQITNYTNCQTQPQNTRAKDTFFSVFPSVAELVRQPGVQPCTFTAAVSRFNLRRSSGQRQVVRPSVVTSHGPTSHPTAWHIAHPATAGSHPTSKAYWHTTSNMHDATVLCGALAPMHIHVSLYLSKLCRELKKCSNRVHKRLAHHNSPTCVAALQRYFPQFSVTYHKTCAWPSGSTVPVTKSAPDLAKSKRGANAVHTLALASTACPDTILQWACLGACASACVREKDCTKNPTPMC